MQKVFQRLAIEKWDGHMLIADRNDHIPPIDIKPCSMSLLTICCNGVDYSAPVSLWREDVLATLIVQMRG